MSRASPLRVSIPRLKLLYSLVLVLALPLSYAFAERLPTALVPIEVFARGFQDLRGLAWGPDQALYASDRDAGVIYRLVLAGGGTAQISVRQAGLRKPGGLAWGPDGLLYVAEEGAGQIVRLNGAPTPVWTGLFRPTWVAVDPDGVMYVTTQDGTGTETKRQGSESEDGFSLLRLRQGTSVPDLLLSGLHHPGGLWVERPGTLLVSLDKRSGESESTSSTLLRLDPTLSPTHLDYLTTLLGPGVKRPAGPMQDVLEALFLGARHYRQMVPGGEGNEALEGALVKQRPGQPPTVLGSGFGEVRGLALDPQGNLYVATKETIYRLRAPTAPTLDRPPEFTNQSPLSLRGTATPDSEISALGGEAPTTAQADPLTGAFNLLVSLTPSTENRLKIYATSLRGQGLTSAPVKVTVSHDDTPPEVTITEGPGGEIGVPEATLTFTGRDNLTSPEALQYAWALDSGPFSLFQLASPVRFTGLADGPHTFRVKARDEAGNETAIPAQWSFTVRTLRVTITEPAAGATVSPGRLLVRGTVDAGGAEVGVVINGFLASVQGTTFAALVPVTTETTSLSAVATTTSGATATSSISIGILPTPPPGVTLETFPAGGAAPLTVTFHLQNDTGRSLVLFEMDFDGNGSVDVTSVSFNEPQTTYTNRGLFVARLRATDDRGQVYTATTLVSVGGIPALEPKWEGMKDALRQGDIPRAITFIHSTARDRYEEIFRRLTSSQLATIGQYLTAIVPVQIGHNGAEYAMRRTRGGEILSFPIWFQMDTDGIWRLQMF